MRNLFLGLVLAVSAPVATFAAESVGAQYENEIVLKGQIVDIVCELTGNCVKECGEGKRVLGLKADDSTIYLIAKGPPLFANANESVLPFCAKPIEVDGLLIKNPKMPLLFVQRYRAAGSADWKDADGFETAWKAKNGEADEWFRKDPLVVELVKKSGPLGIPGLAPKP